MRKIFLFAFLLFVGFSMTAQIINFADPNFKYRLTGYGYAKDVNGNNIEVDLNHNGEIEVSETLNVYQIIIYRNTNLPYLISLSGVEYFTNLKKLACMDQHLSQVDCSQLVNLEEIDFGNNQLVSLNLTGLIHLKKINCFYNVMTSLNTSDLVSLEYLDCSGNQIPGLNLSNSVNLQKLFCLYNNLSSLNIAGLTHLTEVNCETNHLPTLNLTGLTGLTDFRCGSNEMTSLSLPDSNNLTVLFCGANQLTSLTLSNLPLLNYLSCSSNLLSSVDLSNQVNLVTLYCSNNLLTQLDVSNTNLYELNCADNSLESIDISNCRNLFRFTCNDNPNLTYLNLKNGYIETYYYYMNNIPNIAYVCVDEDEYYSIYAKIQNYSGSSYFEINSYCSFTPGGPFYTIHGNQKIDANNDGCDVDDLAYPNLKFLITDGTHVGNFISNSSGNYVIPVFAATHTITPVLENPTYYTISPANISVTFPTEVSPYMQDFCMTPNGVHQDLETWVIPLTAARPGFDARYKIMYRNKGNVPMSGNVTFAFNDEYMDFISAIPIQDNQSDSLLSWNYADLNPFEIREIEVKFNINSPVETPAVNIGDVLKFASTIFPLAGDENSSDNSNDLRQVVVGSIDPNDKVCVEGNIVDPEMIGEYVHYVIRFENTGTFAAENIVVKDIIDTNKFDISTLIPLHASHSYVTKITNANKVEFIFENINLPFDDANNDGYISFKIKIKPTLVVGDTFSNNASIYFDYNFPVVTNTYTSVFQELGTRDFDFADFFSLYPNPANTVLNIKAVNDIALKSISVYNTLGQLVLAFPNLNQIDMIDVSDLKTGSYLIRFVTDRGITSSKFIKK